MGVKILRRRRIFIRWLFAECSLSIRRLFVGKFFAMCRLALIGKSSSRNWKCKWTLIFREPVQKKGKLFSKVRISEFLTESKTSSRCHHFFKGELQKKRHSLFFRKWSRKQNDKICIQTRKLSYEVQNPFFQPPKKWATPKIFLLHNLMFFYEKILFFFIVYFSCQNILRKRKSKQSLFFHILSWALKITADALFKIDLGAFLIKRQWTS